MTSSNLGITEAMDMMEGKCIHTGKIELSQANSSNPWSL